MRISLLAMETFAISARASVHTAYKSWQNNIGFIDNWTRVWGRPDLLKRDGLHPSWGGAALLSRNMAPSLRVRT